MHLFKPTTGDQRCQCPIVWSCWGDSEKSHLLVSSVTALSESASLSFTKKKLLPMQICCYWNAEVVEKAISQIKKKYKDCTAYDYGTSVLHLCDHGTKAESVDSTQSSDFSSDTNDECRWLKRCRTLSAQLHSWVKALLLPLHAFLYYIANAGPNKCYYDHFQVDHNFSFVSAAPLL